MSAVVEVPPRYSARRTLSVRVELVRQLRRRRTLVAFVLVAALPLIVVAAVKLGPQSSSNGGGGGGFGGGNLDLVGLATTGAWNFTVTMLLFATGLLLVVLAALFLGDTVASEASWSTLRYLLTAPVPRRRLLATKAVVGLLLTAGVLLALVVVSFVVGWLAFGSAGLTSPTGGSFDTGESLQRVAIVSAYIGIGLLIPAGVAFLMSVLTDVPLGAVGSAVMIVIVSSILDRLEPLGDLRQLLPSHYTNAWVDALGAEVTWGQMVIGASYACVVFGLMVLIAVLRFERKDITS
jgi:ABC-2 type transport system permease protein